MTTKLIVCAEVGCKWDLHDHKINYLGLNGDASAFYDLRSQTNTVSDFVAITFYHLRVNYGKQTHPYMYNYEVVMYDPSPSIKVN